MANKKRGLYLLVLVICCTTIYFACSPLKVVNGKLAMNLSQYISVDASVRNQDVKSVSPITVEHKSFDQAEIENLYINNKEITFQESIEGKKKKEAIHYKFNDGSSVVTGGTYFKYDTEFSNNFTQLIDIDHPDLLNEQGNNQRQLKFSTKNVVIVEVLERLSTIGMNNRKLSSIYSFDYQELNNRKQKLLDTPTTQEERYAVEKDWTEEDECYLLVFDQFLNDIAIDANDFDDSKVDNSMKNQIVVLYTKDGIQMINATAMYSEKQKEPQEKIMSLKKALKVFKKKYRKENKTEDMHIKEIDLVYVKKEAMSSEDLLLRPAWRFTVYQKVGQGSIDCVYFDAISEVELYNTKDRG